MFIQALLASCLVAPTSTHAKAAERPTLDGPEDVLLTADGRFRIHYTLSGEDRLRDTGDLDPANGVPDPLDWIEEGLAVTDAACAAGDGWPRPAPDEGQGGDDRVDVYVRALDINGYAHYETLPSGAHACWIELEPAMAVGRVAFGSIAAHEYHHCLQWAVGATHPWIHEAVSTYAQYLLFDGDDVFMRVARMLLWEERLEGAALALDTTGDRFEYAGMVWVKYLVDRAGGGTGTILELWRAIVEAGGWEAGHEAALLALGIASLDEATSEYAEWNWFACDRDDGRHYLPTVSCPAPARVPATAAGPLPAAGIAGPIGRHGSAYVEVAPDCSTGDLTLEVSPSARTRFRVIEIAPGAASPAVTEEVAGGATASFAVASWNRRSRIVLVGTALEGPETSFAWAAVADGAYAPPSAAELPPVAGLEVAPAGPAALEVGGRLPLHAAATYGTCADGRDVTAEVTWRTSDPSVVAIGSGAGAGAGAGAGSSGTSADPGAGELEGVGPGAAEVWAEASGAGGAPVTSARLLVEVTGPAAGDGGGCACRAGPRGARARGEASPWTASVLGLALAAARAAATRRRPGPAAGGGAGRCRC